MEPKSQRPEFVWLFDVNHRVYVDGQSGPVWREHWVKRRIGGENRVSYITDYGQKVPKRGGRGIAFSEAEIDELEWAHKNRYAIAGIVQAYGTTSAQLREIAKIVGYEEKQ